MDFLEQVEKAKLIKDEALSCEGISRAILIHTKDVVVDERVRFQCSYAGCRDYGHRYMCPPFTPEVEEFRKILSRYFMGLVVQQEGKITDMANWEPETKEYGLKLHNILYQLEKKAFSLGFPFAAALVGGSCKLCKVCPAKENPNGNCINKEKARPSMEGLGIDVIATCKNVGVDVTFSPGNILLTGLLLIN